MSTVTVHTMPVGRFLRHPVPAGETDWRDGALCAQIGPSLFFPGKGGSDGKAKAVCAACPSRPECLEFALKHDLLGIWGGTSYTDRERIRLQREQEKAA